MTNIDNLKPKDSYGTLRYIADTKIFLQTQMHCCKVLRLSVLHVGSEKTHKFGLKRRGFNRYEWQLNQDYKLLYTFPR